VKRQSAPVPGRSNIDSTEVLENSPLPQELNVAAPGDGRTPATLYAPTLSTIALLAWLVFAELGTEAWYRAHESCLAHPVTWSVKLPEKNPTLRRLPLSEKTRRMLRYDEAVNAAWEQTGLRFQAIFLRWKAGRTAVHLARTHTPEICVTAAGRRMLSKSEVRVCTVGGLRLPFRLYVFDDPRGPLHVWYCLWGDRAPEEGFDSADLSYRNRLAAVLAGRRLCGQRSLELAIWGCADADAAQEVLHTEVQELVHSPQSAVHSLKK